MDSVVNSLDIINNWDDKKTSSKASSLKYAILNFEFITLLLVVSNILYCLGLLLSKNVQSTNLDLRKAVSLAEETKKELENLRKMADNNFNTIF